MNYLLLILFPVAMAGGTYVLRRQRQLVEWAGAATIITELLLALTTPLNQPAQLLDVSINYTQLGQLFLVTFCLGGLVATLTTGVTEHGEHCIGVFLLILGISAAIMIVQEPLAVAVLLLLASLLGGVQLVDQPVDSPTLLRPQTISMALRYTLLVVLGGLLLIIGFTLATAFDQELAASGPVLAQVVFGLLLLGFGVRFGLIPFHVWLPDLLDETPTATSFVHIGLLTVLAVPVLLVALQTQPQLLVGNTSGQRVLIGLGAISALVGGVFAILAEGSRRMIAFLTIANLGQLTIGLGSISVLGVGSALLGALNHIIGIALLVLGLALLEQSIPGRREQAGALRERPIAALALMIGVFLLLGVPPLSGFVPKLMLLVASYQYGTATGLATAASIVLCGIAGAKLLRQLLLRPKSETTNHSLLTDDFDRLALVTVDYAPRPLLALILVLAAASLAIGIWPEPLIVRLDQVVQTLTFLSQ